MVMRAVGAARAYTMMFVSTGISPRRTPSSTYALVLGSAAVEAVTFGREDRELWGLLT